MSGSWTIPISAPSRGEIAATTNAGQGSWDIVTVATDGTGLQTLASGPAFRGAPDWSASGLVWVDADEAGTRLVVTAPDGSAPRTILTLQPSVSLANPRWLKPQ